MNTKKKVAIWVCALGLAAEAMAISPNGASLRIDPHCLGGSSSSPALSPLQKIGIAVTILYDNYVLADEVRADWGFSCMITGTEKSILFDAGTTGSLLLENMDKLQVHAEDADLVVISHNHTDHTGGLLSFLGRNSDVSVYLPSNTPSGTIGLIEATGASAQTVSAPMQMCEHVHLTGPMGSAIIEQSLVLDTSKGLVVITGCAHPGIVQIVNEAKQMLDKDLYLVLGGFHLLNHSDSQVRSIIQQFRDLGVRKVGPTHCTGDRAIELFETAYGQDFIPIGVGTISIPNVCDFNGDGVVDFRDFAFWASSWRMAATEPAWDAQADIGPLLFGDGIITAHDIAELVGLWLTYPDMLAHWKLDETEGGIAHDSIAGNDAFGPPDLLWRPEDGKVRGALELDGIDDVLFTTFSLNPADTSFSVFAWVKGGAPGRVIISQSGGANWLMVDASNGNLMTELKGTGRFDGPLSSQAVITDGDWHRVGLTWDGSNRILYVDDVEVAKDTQTGLAGSNGGLYFGAGKNPSAGNFFSGLLDDIRIYDRAIVP